MKTKHICSLFFVLTLVTGCSCLIGGGNRPPQQHNQRRQPPPKQKIDEAELPEYETSEYTILPGDTLAKISKKFYGSTVYWRYIAEFNGIEDPRNLQIGQVLDIPAKIGYPSKTKIRDDLYSLPDEKKHKNTPSSTAPEKTHKSTNHPKPTPKPRTSSTNTRETEDYDSIFDIDTETTSSTPTATPRPQQPPSQSMDQRQNEQTSPGGEQDDSVNDSSSSEPGKPTGSVYIKQNAPVLNKASSLGEQIGTLRRGCTVEFFEFTRGFYKIEYQGTTGFIHNQYAKEVKDE